MPSIPRLVVTGHDDHGVSVFAADGPVPVVRTAPDGALFYEIWSTDGGGGRGRGGAGCVRFGDRHDAELVRHR